MTALSLAALLTLVQPAKEYKFRTVTAEVSEVKFTVLGEAHGLTVQLNVSEKDARAADREIYLAHGKVLVEGKETKFADAIQWLATAVKVDKEGHEILGSIEATATISDNAFVNVTQIEFRLVPWEKYHPKPKATDAK